jgi:activator of 2-hydroxyglutaryl-CoA dehydratase/predicted nucleotide-binding protein (sugar kinase/HSP70/actin superfamily)
MSEDASHATPRAGLPQHPHAGPLAIGLDVGSTTVKVVAIDPRTREVLHRDYQRHHTRQPEKVLAMLRELEHIFPESPRSEWQLFATGSGASPLCPVIGGRFVQEVNAVVLATKELHPDVGSVIELGGQDAKIIMFQDSVGPDGKLRKNANPSMNDKCASGTGATIDKCMIKVGLAPELVRDIRFDASKIHHVAAKCGVFAETDIVNLVKSAVPAPEILCSLADAIVLQNLSVLTRGSTLKPKVMLLGGPNTYLSFLRECWELRIPETWRDRGFRYHEEAPISELIFTPDGSQYYAAFGAVVYGLSEPSELRYAGLTQLVRYVTEGRKERLGEQAGPPLVANADETRAFVDAYRIPKFQAPPLAAGTTVRAVIGVDGGSTSSKAVLVDEAGAVIAKAYQLSKGNPIDDTKELLVKLREHVRDQGAELEVLGFGATGYAADVLEQTVLADANVVETVAHAASAMAYFGDIDVVCDIGGQDIKVLFLKQGDIAGFRLSNSCSAGNGMLLQAMADQFGLPVTAYAETAFAAELAPKFSYGCAVFLDTDRVNFQKEGFSREELLAGLAQVLPKNVWQYVAQIPRLAALGKKYVLQGGTQYNLAAVKAQVDYIKERVPDAEVLVHPHCGEAGAIGAAFEALRVVKRRGRSSFVGLDAAIGLEVTTKTDESTTCHFCPNECKRTFVDTKRPDGEIARYIAGFSCEKGTVESVEEMKKVVEHRKELGKAHPNMIAYEAWRAFAHVTPVTPLPEAGTPTDDIVIERGFLGLRRKEVRRGFLRSSVEVRSKLKKTRIGMPRVLNMYSTAPYFRAYFEALGIPPKNVVFSEETSEELWVTGGKYGSIDPCFPSKVVQAHVHDLLFVKHEPEKNRPLSYIFFPILTHVKSDLLNLVDHASCPIVAGTPEVMKSAFTKEVDFFKQRGIEYLDPALTFTEPLLTRERMWATWGPRLGVTRDECDHAHAEAMKALRAFSDDLEARGRQILDQVEREDRIALLVLGRPYHSDPGLNHGIPEEFQALGYPILSVRSLPKDLDYLRRFFKDGAHDTGGRNLSPLDINDVWPENYSTNSAERVWAAKVAARHPNLAILDLSSFKCGHDAPTYGIVDAIVQSSGVPHAALHDLDANKPGGSIKIRVKTYHHTLSRRREALEDVGAEKKKVAHDLEQKRLELLQKKREQLEAMRLTDPKLEGMIAELSAKVASYRVSRRVEDALPKKPEPSNGLVQLRKKTPATTSAATDAAE